MSADDGVNSDTFLADNDNSNTRIGFNLRKTLHNGDTLHFRFETAVGLRGSSGTTPTDNNFTVAVRSTDLRHFSFTYASERFGEISVGQGSTATDGVAEIDLSGTDIAAYSSLSDIGGGVAFRTVAGAQSAVSVGDVFGNFDGSRRFRLRYDTPTFNGFSAAVSYGQEVLNSGDSNDYYDAAIRYNKTLGDFTIASGLWYSDRDTGNERAIGSVSVRHNPTGLNGTLAACQSLGGDEEYIFAKIGVIRDWVDFGSTALSVEYYDGSDFASVGSSSQAYSVSAVQKIDRYNLELYATYRTYEFSDATTTYQDVNAAFVGARFKF